MLAPTVMWTNLAGTVLSEMSQSQQDKSCVTPSHEVPRGVRVTETGSRWWCQGWGRGEECSMGTEFQFGMMESSEDG